LTNKEQRSLLTVFIYEIPFKFSRLLYCLQKLGMCGIFLNLAFCLVLKKTRIRYGMSLVQKNSVWIL